jgi:hypothetical protein
LLEWAGPEDTAGIWTESKHRIDQRIKMVFRFAIVDPGQSGCELFRRRYIAELN